MKLVYKGKYRDESQLPVREHPEGYRAFREPQSMSKLALIANGISMAIMVAFAWLSVLRGRTVFEDFYQFASEGYLGLLLGMIAMLLSTFPHEILHALCFRDEVELYTNLKKGMLFVVGVEDMSKGRFIFMSLLPNIVFGFIPFIIYMLFPGLTFFAGLGVLAVGAGAGDYMNVFNCLTQVPDGAKVYMSGMHSYWYMPGEGHTEQITNPL